MPVDKKLLDILVCPVSGAALELLDDDNRTRVNEQISAGALRYADGEVVNDPLEAALRTTDGHTLYRIDSGIPVMLPDRGICCETRAKS